MKKITILLISLLSVIHIKAQDEQLIDGIMGVVGSKIILHSDIETLVLQAKQNGSELGNEPECTLFQDLMFQALLINQAEVDSLEVSAEQVNADLENRIRYFEKQIGGRKKLEAYYGKSIEDIKAEFYSTIEDRMKAERMKQKITSAINITPSQVKVFYNKLPKDSIPLIGSKIEVAHITKNAKVSDEVKKATKEKLKKYRTEILKGERTFASTAVFYSNDPGTKGDGGEFDWVARGTFVPEFDRVAFTMKEGDVSEVFETDYGFHILELFERRGNNEYRGRHILLIPEVSANQLAKAKSFLDSIHTLIKNGTYTFEEAAAKFSEDKETKNSGGLIYNQQTASSLFEINQLDKQLFMVVDGLKVGEMSKPVAGQSRDGKFYQIVKLKSQSKPHKANLKDDYQLIVRYATNDAKAAAMNKWIKEKTKSTYIKVDKKFVLCSFMKDWK